METRNSTVLTGSVVLVAGWIAWHAVIAGLGHDQFASGILWFAGSVASVYLLAQFEHSVARRETFRQAHQSALLEVPMVGDSLPPGALGVSPPEGGKPASWN